LLLGGITFVPPVILWCLAKNRKFIIARAINFPLCTPNSVACSSFASQNGLSQFVGDYTFCQRPAPLFPLGYCHYRCAAFSHCPLTILGFFIITAGFFLLLTSLFLIIRVPGQMRTFPERLVLEGPYQWIRHPMYLSHFLLIGGSTLACRALKVFLETSVLLGIATIGGRYEESARLLPLFGRTFEQY
jgi:hypothetical protein